MIEFDIAKSLRNIELRGLPFTVAIGFDFSSAMIREVNRDGERRCVAIGLVGNREFVLVFTRRGDRIRVISLRKANSRERRSFHDHSW